MLHLKGEKGTKMGFFLFDFIKFLYNDIKTDLHFIKEIINGNRKLKLDHDKLQELKDWRGILKENWLLFLVVLAAWCGGYFFATVHLNNACADAVQQWVIQNDLYDKLAVPVNNSFNLTKDILNISFNK